MKKLWKKPAVRITAAAVIVVALALLGLWIWSLDPWPVKSVDFLAGREFFRRIKNEKAIPSYRIVTETCSFDADFNDICTRADAELLARGFKAVVHVPPRPGTRRYVLQKKPFGEWTSVTIYGGKRFDKFALKQSSQDPNDYGCGYESRDGWVAVEVAGKQLQSNFLDTLLDRLKLRWQTAKLPPPPPPVKVRSSPQSDEYIAP